MRKLALGACGRLGGCSSDLTTQATAIDEVNTLRLRNAVTVNGILQHERAFQRIANNNGGTRASGTPGYDASAAYVARTLRRAGYNVRDADFDFAFFQDLAPGELEEISPTARDYRDGNVRLLRERRSHRRAGATIDVVIPATDCTQQHSGCEPGDFPAPPAGPAIALIQRGTCDFAVKAANAAAAGYEAAIIFNEGNPGRTDLFIGTLAQPVEHPRGRGQLRGRRGPVHRKPGWTPSSSASRPPRRAKCVRPSTCSRTRSAARRTRSSWSGPTWIPCLRVQASTTTAVAVQRSWRSPRRWRHSATTTGTGCSARSASPSGVPKRTDCSARSTTSEQLTDRQLDQALREPQLRHGRLAQLRPLRLRR